MRILYAIDGTGVGGAETLLLGLMAAARSRGHEVHLAFFTPGPLADRMAAEAKSVTRLSRHGLRDPLAGWRACRLIRRLRPDVVHSHLTKSDLVLQPAAWLLGVPRRLVTLHNTDRWRARRPLAWIYRLLTLGAQRVLAVSDEVARHARETGSVAADRLQVVANGVDLDRFLSLAPPEFPPPDGRHWRLAVIGRLHPQKDHATFLAAAALLAARRADVAFQVIGDGPLRAELEALARGLGLTGRLSFTGNRADIAAALAETDALVLSSAWEGLPMVLLEAMAAARPVVATAVGEVAAVLGQGGGLSVPPRDPAALAAAMLRLIEDPEQAREMGRAGRAQAIARFDGRRMHDRILALYGDVAEGRATSPLA